ncbi:MAG: hypothetical protein U0X91_03525 [Spirosomataceae bacterium]
MILLDFAQKFYNFIKYNDQVLLQISFVNVLDFAICDFNRRFGLHLFPPILVNNQHNNFKLNYRFNANTITYDDILSIANNHSMKISRAFGNESDSLFEDDSANIRFERINTLAL